MTDRHSSWVVSKFRSWSFKIIYQYPILSSTISSCVCNGIHPIWQADESMSTGYHASFLDKTNIGGAISTSCKVRNVVISSPCKCLRVFACYLRCLAVNGDAMQTRFEINWRITLQKAMHDRNLFSVVSISKSSIALVVWSATSSRPGRITWHR